MNESHRRPSASSISLLAALALLAAACTPPDRGAVDARRPDLAFGGPEGVGLSSEALAQIQPTMQGMIDEGHTAGIMTLVARHGRVVHWEAVGDRVLGDPLEPNDVFRIYSMTKPITSVAVMMLVDEGAIGLDDPLALYVPAFTDVQVLDDGVARAPNREITIRDLLRHSSGLTYGIFGNGPVDVMYREELGGVLNPQSGVDLTGFVDRLSRLPLLADPGARWNYSLSTDVLGRVVEVASGLSLDDFFRTRIFEPLEMHETAFHVPTERRDRFTGVYRSGANGLEMIDSPESGPFTRPPTWHSGGGGLTSTAMDYLRFTQMLLNEGELDGVRILRSETVRDMTRDQLPTGVAMSGEEGFGLGFSVATSGSTPGVYRWSGVMNTYFWIDPIEDLVAFVWTQYDPFGGIPLLPTMRGLVRESLIESNRAVGAGMP
jgi:CubicO group peptidase (beta-lactamase class C family)